MLTHSFRLPKRGCCLAEKRTGGIISFFPGLAWPTLFSGPQLGQRRRGRAVRSFRQAPRPLSSRQDRSTAQLPPALVRRDRATPKLRSRSTAFWPSLRIAAVRFLILGIWVPQTRYAERRLLTILHEQSRRIKRQKGCTSRGRSNPRSSGRRCQSRAAERLFGDHEYDKRR